MIETRAKIMDQIKEIQCQENVKVLFACESGSRAWGFPSVDSDYDVRFLYVHPAEWYLSIDLDRKRDVIERDLTDSIDLSGWDLRKALGLYRKTNPPLAEWLGSPIVYAEHVTTAQRMRDLLPEFYNPLAAAYYYWHMAKGNYREYLKRDVVWVKKYFYVLRPLFAIRWLESGLGYVPTDFDLLMKRTVDSYDLRAAINDLIKQKKDGAELDWGPKIPIVSDFVDAEMAQLSDGRFDIKPVKGPTERLNAVFRDALEQTRDVTSI